MARRTTITIFEETKKTLDNHGKKNESYDELLQRILKRLEEIALE
jgi:hypothetical protein